MNVPDDDHDYDWRLMHINHDVPFDEYDYDYFVNVYCATRSTRRRLGQALDDFTLPVVTHTALDIVYYWLE